MNEEEWQFLIVVLCCSIVAAAVILNDVFSLRKFWARLTRSKRPPTPEALLKAHTRHQTFYHHTDWRLLSYIGVLLMAGIIFIQKALEGSLNTFDERLLRLGYVTFFFLVSRWYYRQEAHYVTAHKLFTILSCFLFIDFVHWATGLEYMQAAPVLVTLWIWMIGVVRAVVGYEVNYARTITLSFFIPLAALIFLLTSQGIVIFGLFIPGIIVTLKEFVDKSELDFKRVKVVKKIFPHPLPFFPVQPDSFLNDVALSSHPRVTFSGCSVWEVLFWGSMTPVVLIPVMQYLQSREEQLQQWHDDLTTWSQKEYILNPETVADRLGLTLEDTYPLLNELTEEGYLTLYESLEGLVYGLPPSEEMDAFITRLNLRKTDLPETDRELLEYLWEKTRTKQPTTVLLSVINTFQRIEVSYEPAGGTLSPLKGSVSIDTGTHLEQVSRDITYYVSETIGMLSDMKMYTLKSPRKFLVELEKRGKNLLECAVPQEIAKEFDMSHLALETNMDDTPFELMYADTFFALKYGIGRRLRVTGAIPQGRYHGRGALRALIIADPQSNLKGAINECEYVERELSRLMETRYLFQEEATLKEVLTRLIEGYSIIHYAGHAGADGLHLSDAVLHPDMLESLVIGTPIVFVNGCKSARSHTKLAEAFLRGGALGYIGNVWELHDVAAAELAAEFYKNSIQNSIGEALRRAKASEFYKNNIAWLCFILFGDPTLRLI
jgi:hypothetical protein